ncbi:MAG: Tim44/TimA family putative adaptor protein, partial [Pseudomonadota bacterium]|nr:Tim44/TimA family putative adaptor protein [Pseudomonadota bacterium]
LFKDDEFMQGAASAFSMVLQAFADGDLSTLRRLLAFELYEEFAQSIHTRNKEGDQLTITVHGINDVQLTDGSVKDSIASVTVTFVSEQSRTVKNNAGDIVEDESEERAGITDIWVFERDTQLDDPNWKLVETQNEFES